MQDMRLTGQFTDIILVAETVEFKAHKLVLANTSDYFRAMFSGNFNENNNSNISNCNKVRRDRGRFLSKLLHLSIHK